LIRPYLSPNHVLLLLIFLPLVSPSDIHNPDSYHRIPLIIKQEVDWLSLHPEPITILVHLPSHPEKPEWKLDGSSIQVTDLPVNITFGIVRERIKRTLGADLPVSRMQLSYEGKVLSNGATLASVNLDEGDELGLVLKKK
jgi:splicing factor 3A subunit 1